MRDERRRERERETTIRLWDERREQSEAGQDLRQTSYPLDSKAREKREKELTAAARYSILNFESLCSQLVLRRRSSWQSQSPSTSSRDVQARGTRRRRMDRRECVCV